MLLVCLYSLTISVVVYLLAFKLEKRTRLIMAFSLFLGLPIMLFVYVLIIGDRPSPAPIGYDPSGKQMPTPPPN